MKTTRLNLALWLLLFTTTLFAASAKTPEGILTLPPRPAPSIQLTDIDGAAYTLENDRGALVFVHFWASWCVPCRREMPAIQRMWQIMEKEGLRIALINTAEDEDTVFSFLSTYAPDIRPLLDKDGRVTETWQPRGLPATYLVNQKGQIVYQALGGRPWDEKPYLDFLRSLISQRQ